MDLPYDLWETMMANTALGCKEKEKACINIYAPYSTPHTHMHIHIHMNDTCTYTHTHIHMHIHSHNTHTHTHTHSQNESQIFPPTTVGAEKMAADMGVTFLGRLPLDPRIGWLDS